MKVQIDDKEPVLTTAILLVHGEDDHAANLYFHTMLEKIWSSKVSSNSFNNFHSISKYVFQMRKLF